MISNAAANQYQFRCHFDMITTKHASQISSFCLSSHRMPSKNIDSNRNVASKLCFVVLEALCIVFQFPRKLVKIRVVGAQATRPAGHPAPSASRTRAWAPGDWSRATRRASSRSSTRRRPACTPPALASVFLVRELRSVKNYYSRCIIVSPCYNRQLPS